MKKTLKEFRTEKGLTQGEMANKLGMSISNYCKKENNQLRISLQEAKQISELFKEDISDIFF